MDVNWRKWRERERECVCVCVSSTEVASVSRLEAAVSEVGGLNFLLLI
jgi:hypothetical protein